LKKKKGLESTSVSSSPVFKQGDRDEAKIRLRKLAPDFSEDSGRPPALDANVVGLEKLHDKLNETGKKILNVIITDFAADNPVEKESDVFKKLRNACKRAGMLGNTSDQIKFFQTLADPRFIGITKAVGQGVIGMYLVPIVAKVVQQALEGDKTSQQWALQITGMLQTKYDFYLNRYELTHNSVHADVINFEGKSDGELERIVNGLDDATEAEEVAC